jgi:hypothetical protein
MKHLVKVKATFVDGGLFNDDKVRLNFTFLPPLPPALRIVPVTGTPLSQQLVMEKENPVEKQYFLVDAQEYLFEFDLNE